MAIENVNPNVPGSNAIKKLNDNTRKSYDRAIRANFDTHEIENLYDAIGTQRRYTRELNLGHTTSSYTSWSHLSTDDGYAIWKYPVTDFVDSDDNELYRTDVSLVYKGSASTESTPTSFTKVLISDSKKSGTSWYDVSAEASSTSGTPFTLVSSTSYTETNAVVLGSNSLAYENIVQGTLNVYSSGYVTAYTETLDFTVDYDLGVVTVLSTGSISSGANIIFAYRTNSTLYMGYSAVYTTIYFNLATKGVGNSLTYKYSSGSSWTTFTPTDSTNNWSITGNIAFTASGWTTATVSATSGLYWTRIRPTVTPVVKPTVYQTVIANNSITTLLKMSQDDIEGNNYTWGYLSGYVYVCIPNAGDSASEGIKYIKSSSTDTVKRNFFIYNNTYTTNYLNNTAESGGIWKLTLTTKTSSYTASTEQVILCNASGGNITITLPSASSSANIVYTIKKIDSSANTVIIDGAGSETVDGELTQTLTTQWDVINTVCDGTEWFTY